MELTYKAIETVKLVEVVLLLLKKDIKSSRSDYLVLLWSYACKVNTKKVKLGPLAGLGEGGWVMIALFHICISL